MLPVGYTSILEAGSRDDFRREVVRFSQSLGFNTVSAMAVVDLAMGRSEFVSIDNAPDGYAAAMHDVPAMRRDPVMQHCRHQSVPIIWDQDTYTRRGLGELWEEQARFGYHTGIAMALHLPEGRHFAFGVERDQPLPSDGGELQRLVADLQLFAVHAQDAAMRLLSPLLPQVDLPALTPRELEALRWTMEGKTAWEVGAILGISERTAVLHVNNAMHKLGCTSKHQAVLRALRLGLIS
ncbi:helix-turn-helix transcriptional regulator [Pseudaquabacterium pictum]|uniref:LuxR family transcriptional regulator n=1 Tax=Pseudaquabacterium pictum TaxID=2315236 RepID=A0A480AXI5_9BURK|nr:autoinducer binding domain-containing protein [Rubrivivax pictus]GCL64827.1 LuxR family transcriptional regulator [Rubrivivax pictus]